MNIYPSSKETKIFITVNGCNLTTKGFKIKIEISYCSAFIYSVSSNLANLFSMFLRCSFHVWFSSNNISRDFMDSSCFILCLLIFKFGNRKRKRNIETLSVLLGFWKKRILSFFDVQGLIYNSPFFVYIKKIETV